jgi:hypothetical protein
VKVHQVHERRLDAPPERVKARLEEGRRLWPEPLPASEEERVHAGLGFWQRTVRVGPRRYRVVSREDFRGDHWFEVQPDGEGGTILRHTVEGEASGDLATQWRDRVESMHDSLVEALLDQLEWGIAREH